MKPTDFAFHFPGFTYPSGEFEHPIYGMDIRTWMAGQVAAGTGYSGMQVGTDSQADRIITLADAILERLQKP